jgi:hypothetical protein
MFPIEVSRRRRKRGSIVRKLSGDSPPQCEAHDRYGPYNLREGAK